MSAAALALDEARIVARAAEQADVAHLAQATAGDGVHRAYAIQHAGIALRIGRGEVLCGIKMGFTSRAKMAQMGVSEMIVGQLTDAMRLDDSAVLRRTAFIHPRVEPEIAFRLSRELPASPGVEDIARCVDAVAPAMEIIDSRYRDFRFDLDAVVADNTSAAAFVVGAWCVPPARLDNLGLVMRIEGGAQAVEVAGSTAAILGDPWRALAAAARLAAQHGLRIPAGAIVLAGAATAAEALPARGFAQAEMAGLGRVQFHIE